MTENLYEWTSAARDALGLDHELSWVADRETVGAVLDLAKDVAHGVARPAAPVAAFLAGVALGAAKSPDRAAFEAALERLRSTVPPADEGG
jgi:hypothetical protein